MHRRIWTLILACMLLVMSASCGQSRQTTDPTEPQATDAQTAAPRDAEGDIASPQAQAPAQDAPQDPDQPADAADEPQSSDGQLGELFEKHVRAKVSDGTYTLRTEQTGVKIVVVVDGDDSVIDSDASGLLRFSLVHKGDDYFMVMHTAKKYARMTETEYKKQVNTVGSSTFDLDNMQLQSSGTETVNGKEYKTETYDEGVLGVVTYFFDDNGVQRTRVVRNGVTKTVDVFVVTDDADASAFEIPSNYKLVSDPAQLLT